MNTKIHNVMINDEMLTVYLQDGRIVSVPLAWYPTLMNASVIELNNFKLIGGGSGIHWIDIDEDLSLDGIISGIPGRQIAVA